MEITLTKWKTEEQELHKPINLMHVEIEFENGQKESYEADRVEVDWLDITMRVDSYMETSCSLHYIKKCIITGG